MEIYSNLNILRDHLPGAISYLDTCISKFKSDAKDVALWDEVLSDKMINLLDECRGLLSSIIYMFSTINKVTKVSYYYLNTIAYMVDSCNSILVKVQNYLDEFEARNYCY